MVDIIITDDDAAQTEQLSNVLSREKNFRILRISKDGNEKINPTFQNDLDMLFFRLEIKPYTKGSNYLKMAISIAYIEHSEDINISSIAKKIAGKYNVSSSDSIQSAMDKTVKNLYPKTLKDTTLQKFFSSDYKITTKDFIIRAIYYIDSK